MIPGSQNAVALEFRRKLSSLPWQPAPHSDNLSPCDFVRFWRWAPSASVNLPSIKRAGSPHYTVIRLKPHFVQLLTVPKRIDQFTVISALLSTPNICVLLSDMSL